MFGYIRPYKSDLLMRQWSYYQSVYCGLCKSIGKNYGQLPRLTVTYDLTFLALLLFSVSEQEASFHNEVCVLNPIKKKTVMTTNAILEITAAVSVMLAWYKGKDNLKDGKYFSGRAINLGLNRVHKKIAAQYSEIDNLISKNLSDLDRYEQQEPDLGAGNVFGRLLAEIFEFCLKHLFQYNLIKISEAEQDSLTKSFYFLGNDVGKWIYLIDAIDDLEQDRDNKNWNPFLLFDGEKARTIAAQELENIELSIDRSAALLPYIRDSSMIANIVQKGLPSVRQEILSGHKLKKL